MRGHPTDGGNIRRFEVGSGPQRFKSLLLTLFGPAQLCPVGELSSQHRLHGGIEGNGGSLAFMAGLLLL
jgi:hypothetical protein